jgi:hypothetical protein
MILVTGATGKNGTVEATAQAPHNFSEFARDHKAAFLQTKKGEDAVSPEPETAHSRARL